MFKPRLVPFLLCLSILQLSQLIPLIPATSAEESTTKEFEQAERAFEAYKFAEAQDLYGQALKKYRQMGNLAAYIENQIAKCLRYQKKAEEAVAAYRLIKERYPESPLAGEVQEAVARTYYEAGDYAKAGPEFEKLGEESAGPNEQVVDVSGASVGNDEYQSKRKIEALGYASFCYSEAGDKMKQMMVEMRIKEEISKSKGRK